MNCRSCGAPLSPGVRFCSKCGAPDGGRPSREEVRARIRGGGRHAAPTRGASLARHGAPGRNGVGTEGSGKTRLLLVAAGLLWALQIVYLFVHALFINMNYGDFNLGNISFSVYGALREGAGTLLGVLLILSCLAGLASLVVPKLLLGRRMPGVTAFLAALTLALYVIALISISNSFDKAYFGVKPTMGLAVWLFLFNCVLIGVLSYLAGQGEEPAPARVPVPRRPAASRTAPVRNEAAPRRTPTSGRTTTAQRNVTPPDAETIAALRRMAQMHKQGLVSDEEFARIKAECVARGWIRE